MKKVNYRAYLPYIVLACMLVVLLIIGTLYDLEISKNIYLGNNPFSILFESFGWMVGYAFVPIFSLLGFYNRAKGKKAFWTYRILAITIALLGFTLTMKNALDYLQDRVIGYPIENNYLLSGVIAAILTILLLRFGKKFTNRYFYSLIGIGIVIVYLFLGYLIFVELLCKPLFSRTRFDDMFIINDFANFSHWYQVGAGGSSFPSGHTANAAVILFLAVLPDFFKNIKWKRWILVVIAYVYIFLMALSRVLLGRHFVSDVTFSIILMSVLFLIMLYTKPYHQLRAWVNRRHTESL